MKEEKKTNIKFEYKIIVVLAFDIYMRNKKSILVPHQHLILYSNYTS